MFVVGPDVFASETLDNQNDDVLFELSGRFGVVGRRVDLRHLCTALEVVGHDELVRANGA